MHVTSEAEFNSVAKFVSETKAKLTEFQTEIESCSLTRLAEIKQTTEQISHQLRETTPKAKFRHLSAPLITLATNIINACHYRE